MSKAIDFSLQYSPNYLVKKFEESGIQLYIKREDLLHPEVSGNKFRKLKYNLKKAQEVDAKTLLTFGGAFSNHIAALAAAGKAYNFETIGLIRGEELAVNLEKTLKENATLRFAVSCGMKLKFISRTSYKEKTSPELIEKLKKEFGEFYLIPEGGTNLLAIKGCEEILSEEDKEFDFVGVSVGTGGTISGIINSTSETQKILGFSALKGDFLKDEIAMNTSSSNWELISKYHFGGYGKVSEELIQFINTFYKTYQIPLDPIYTGKMFYGLFDMIEKSAFPQNSRILAIHTGGLQGIPGMNAQLTKRNQPLIDFWNEL
ncbi:pyridoxal-phosphate dependent enzyme [Gillisia sp. M10.2A]|uniref:Pyridoxal-phosphate dependent enzyme n=1 Tax=Gillisia lutea TaxID=2909668 RepID=A0ABS9EEC1_9FLAO|nr:pyridoxal-phosphate dependent enzyme [Gillisia lutea]MCF4101210.1 pyridoxal-phosphate dependent enzyme [Gillisia lutea]